MASSSHDPYRGHSARGRASSTPGPVGPDAGDDAAAGPGELEQLTVAELRAELGERGLSTAGRKAELVARLEAHS
jgi:hypothetical protein